MIGAGLALAAVGLGVLTQVGGSPDADLAILVGASLVVSLGLAPVFTATTDLIVASAPPERAGAASGISETGAELGGALGIAILGSIGMAVYRASWPTRSRRAIPAEAAAVARDTLGGAVGVASQLGGQAGAALVEAAREAFVQGLQLTVALSAAVAVGVAVMAAVLLRGVPAGPRPSPTSSRPPSRSPPPHPSRSPSPSRPSRSSEQDRAASPARVNAASRRPMARRRFGRGRAAVAGGARRRPGGVGAFAGDPCSYG